MPSETNNDQRPGPEPVDLPVEVEIFIEADGSVTFADLAAEVAPIAEQLNPAQPLACDPAEGPAGQQTEEQKESANDA